MLRLASVLLLSAVAAAQDTAAPERFAPARTAIEAEIAANRAPSLAVAVYQDGVVWAEGFGFADIERERRADADTIYRLASISKPFTATAIMQLVERDLVDLDAPVNRYLEQPLRAYRGSAEQITVRRLLNHTGGLPTHWNFFYGPERAPARAATIRSYGFGIHEPGTQTNYSNFAFGVLDHVIARVGKRGYRTWLVEELLDPLGMAHTDVGVRPGKQDHAAIGYRRQNKAWTRVAPYGFDHDGASAVRSSANDLMRFARLQIEASAGEGQPGSAQARPVLSAASLRSMRERTAETAGSAFGIGWSVGQLGGRTVLRHSGGMPGVSTQLLVMPEDRLAVTVLNNSGNRGATNRVLSAILACLPGSTDPGRPPRPAAPGPQKPLGPGTWRGVLSHPDGPIPLTLKATQDSRDPSPRWTSSTWEMAVAGAAPVTAKPQALIRQRPVSLRASADLAVGHGDRHANSLWLQLDDTPGGLAGVGYAEAPGVCRLPIWCELQREEPKPKNTLRVVSYNVLVGMRDFEVGRFLPGYQRQTKIAAWLAAQQPDVVALQEVNGFTEASLAKFAAGWNHDHVALLKEDGYPVALTSRAPIEVIARHRDDLHHGMLHATTHETDFVVVHYKPHPGIDAKRRESERALHCYRQAVAAGRECLVIGDFNSIHPADTYRFSAAARERYERWRYLVRDDLPAEIAIDPLLGAGLVDTFAARGTIPSELPLPRIDFILASPKLMARCSSSRWLCDDKHLRWSDHPPAIADFARSPATNK